MEKYIMLLDWKINIAKMITLPKSTYRFNAIPVKIPLIFSTDLEQIIFKLLWRDERPQVAKTILNRVTGIKLPNFTLCSEATVIKAIWY